MKRIPGRKINRVKIKRKRYVKNAPASWADYFRPCSGRRTRTEAG